MYGRADDKNWGPDPHASIEVIKREKEQQEKSHDGVFTKDAKGTADTNELDVKTPLKKFEKPFD